MLTVHLVTYKLADIIAVFPIDETGAACHSLNMAVLISLFCLHYF